MRKIENGIGYVKNGALVSGEFVLPGYTHVVVDAIDDVNDIYSIKVVDDDINSEEELVWIVRSICCGEAKLVA